MSRKKKTPQDLLNDAKDSIRKAHKMIQAKHAESAAWEAAKETEEKYGATMRAIDDYMRLTGTDGPFAQPSNVDW